MFIYYFVAISFVVKCRRVYKKKSYEAEYHRPTSQTAVSSNIKILF